MKITEQQLKSLIKECIKECISESRLDWQRFYSDKVNLKNYDNNWEEAIVTNLIDKGSQNGACYVILNVDGNNERFLIDPNTKNRILNNIQIDGKVKITYRRSLDGAPNIICSADKVFETRKLKVGDTLIETKRNLRVKFIGLNEDKTHARFMDKTKKTYSMSKQGLINAIKEGRMQTII